MTKDMISETAALKALLSKTADHQILAEMLGFVADRLVALGVDQLCGAEAHERSNARLNHRNGYRPRPLSSLQAATAGQWMGNPRRGRRCADPEAVQGVIFPGVSGAPSRFVKGYDGGDTGSLHSGRLDAFSGRSGQSNGYDRHFQKPGLAPVRRDRRTG